MLIKYFIFFGKKVGCNVLINKWINKIIILEVDFRVFVNLVLFRIFGVIWILVFLF